MPLPQDDTLPKGAEASGSHTSAPLGELSSSEMLEKFQKLGQEAAAEEEDEDDEGEDGPDDGEVQDVGGPSGSGAGGEGKKKKKKKKKGKASKAVAKLKSVLLTWPTKCVRADIWVKGHRDWCTISRADRCCEREYGSRRSGCQRR